MASKFICPACGWAGARKELTEDIGCPHCGYESPATLNAMLHNEIGEEFDAVRMDKFLPHVIRWAQAKKGGKP